MAFAQEDIQKSRQSIEGGGRFLGGFRPIEALHSVSYNFSSGKKFNTKRIDQGNSEEKNRIGN
jgi:hypothetical protein